MNGKFCIFIVGCVLSLMGQAQVSTLQEMLNRKQYAVIIAQADSLMAVDSADYVTLYAIGQAYEGMLKYKEAYRCYQHCLSADTSNIDRLNAVARTATSLGRAADAERYFHRVLASDSLNFYANYQLARLYFQLGDYNKSIEKYQKLQEQDDNNPTLWQNIGDCYTRLESYPGAVLCYFQAYNLNRENAGLAGALINTMLRLGGDYVAETLAVCDTALYYSPDNRQLLRNKGMALYMSKRYTEADTLYSNLCAAGDSSYFTLKYGGASGYYAGQYLKSIDLLELAYEVDTTSVEVCLLLGSALGKTYDRKRAFALLDQAEEGLKPNETLMNQLSMFRAETYQKNGQRTEAARLYYQIWKKSPLRLDVLASIRNMYFAQDIKKMESEKECQNALFIYVLYLNEFFKSGETSEGKGLFFFKPFLQSCYEDLFFRGATEMPMLAPDGKVTSISLVDLRALINKLPDMP